MGKVKSSLIQQHASLPVTLNALNRRMFLRGLGTSLALPFLPSLYSQNASAADADFRKMVLMAYSHGVYWDNWRPQNVTLSSVGNNVRAGSLANATLGSYMPTALNAIRSKISIVEGLDHLCAYGHSRNAPFAAGGHAGGNDWEDPLSKNSIDVLLGKSSAVYPVGPRIPVLRANVSAEPYSFHYENGQPQLLSGTDPKDFFDKVTGSITSSTSPATPAVNKKGLRRQLIVDSAFDAIQKLMGSTKISSADKTVASNYFDHLRDVQTRVHAEASSTGTPGTGSSLSCNATFTAPSDAASQARNIADTMLLALACGVTRLATFILPSEHDLVHRVDDPNVRVAHANYLRDESLFIAAYVMTKMDSITEGNGKTMLENSVALLTSDNGNSKYDNHCGVNVPVIVGGGLNGLFRMGQYVSYYDTSSPIANQAINGYPGAPVYGGRPYNDLLISIMRGMGMTSAQYKDPATGGFGAYARDCTGCAANGDGSTNQRTESYYKTKYFPANPNKDVTLPYIYMGA